MATLIPPRIRRNVADGIHMVQHADVNAYVVVDGRRAMAVDAGLPSTWNALCRVLAESGIVPSDLEAVVLTHGHFDHVGTADRFRRLGVPVYVHRDDMPLASHPYRYRPQKNRFVFPLFHPGGLPHLAKMTLGGALAVKGVPVLHDLHAAGTAHLPGKPEVVHSPGHTDGHCALHFPGRGALITGDALVTLDPYTGRRGPRLVARAATTDPEANLRSLDALEATDAPLVLPGHGDPFQDGAVEACRLARLAGAA